MSSSTWSLYIDVSINVSTIFHYTFHSLPIIAPVVKLDGLVILTSGLHFYNKKNEWILATSRFIKMQLLSADKSTTKMLNVCHVYTFLLLLIHSQWVFHLIKFVGFLRGFLRAFQLTASRISCAKPYHLPYLHKDGLYLFFHMPHYIHWHTKTWITVDYCLL